MRAVLDASVIVAAVWTRNPSSASRIVLEAASAGGFELVVTDEIEAEYRDVLTRDKLQRRAHGLSPRSATDVLESLLAIAERVEPSEGVRVIEDDPDDDKYVAAALGGEARFIVTLDRRHMLVLGEYQGVRFVTPGEFVAVLRDQDQ